MTIEGLSKNLNQKGTILYYTVALSVSHHSILDAGRQ